MDFIFGLVAEPKPQKLIFLLISSMRKFKWILSIWNFSMTMRYERYNYRARFPIDYRIFGRRFELCTLYNQCIHDDRVGHVMSLTYHQITCLHVFNTLLVPDCPNNFGLGQIFPNKSGWGIDSAAYHAASWFHSHFHRFFHHIFTILMTTIRLANCKAFKSKFKIQRGQIYSF